MSETTSRLLNNQAIGITVACGLVALAAWGGFTFRDREADGERTAVARIDVVAAEMRSSHQEHVEKLHSFMLTVKTSNAELLAAIREIGAKISSLEETDRNIIKTCMSVERIVRWSEVLAARNPTMNVPDLSR